MRLIYLILLILTNALTAFSTTVIVDPYKDIDYKEPTTYWIDGEEIVEESPCDNYTPYSWSDFGD